jgi:hypothetical protein
MSLADWLRTFPKEHMNFAKMLLATTILAAGFLVPSAAFAAPSAVPASKIWCQVKGTGDGMELAIWAANTVAGQQAAAASCGYALSLGDFYAISSSTPADGRAMACSFWDAYHGAGIAAWSMNNLSYGSSNAASWCYNEAVHDNYEVVWPDGSVTPPGGP